MADNINVHLSATGTDQYNDAFNRAAETTSNFEKRAEATQRSLLGFTTVFSTVQKVVQAGITVIASTAKDAVSQFDTMRNFPRIMEQMGFSADVTTRNLDKMQASIEALPTTIDEIVDSARGIAVMTKDMDRATNIAIAMNNAFYASGSGAADASRGLNQFNQMMAAGKVDMQSWRTLLETMPLALDKVAESFGFAGASAKNDLYAALQDGTITFDQFTDRIVELNEKTDEFVGFAELAKTATGGLGTAMQNLRNSIVKGLADGLATIDEALKRNGLMTMSETVDKIRGAVTKAFVAINKVISKAIDVFAKMAKFVKTYSKPIITAILGIVAAITAFKVAQHAQELVIGLFVAFDDARKKITGFVQALQAGTLGIGQMIAIVTIAITALVAITQAFMTATGEAAEMKKRHDELVKSISEGSDAYREWSAERENEARAMKVEANHVEELSARYDELAGKENRNASEKRELAQIVEELNSIYDDLNIQYDAENDSLAEGNALTSARIALSRKQKQIEQIEDNITEALEGQRKARENLAAAEEEQRIAEENLAIARERMSRGEAGAMDLWNVMRDRVEQTTEMVAEAKATEQGYTDALQGLYNQRIGMTQEVKTAELEMYRAEQTALQDALATQTVTLDMLSEENQDTVNELRSTWQSYVDDATNMFGALSNQTDMTVAKMVENMQQNQAVISQWGENMQQLRNRFAELGLDDAVLEQFQSMGPEGAAYVAQAASLINTESEDQLVALAETFAKGGETSMEAMKKSMNVEELDPAIESLIKDTEDSLATRVRNANWGSMGEYIDKALADSIRGNAGYAASAATYLADVVKNRFVARMEIASPSKVMIRIAKFIPQGVAKGIELTASVVKKAIDKVSEYASAIEIPQFRNSTMRLQIAGAGGEVWNTGGSTLFDSLRDAIEAVKNRPIVVQNDLQIDGRSFAKSTTQFISDEQQAQADFDAFRKGERL